MAHLHRLYLTVTLLVVLCLRASGQDEAVLKDRLRQAELANSLDAPGVRPWHLTFSFELLDAKGKATQTGTVDQWWIRPDLQKITYHASSAKWTEIRNDQGIFRSPGDDGDTLLAELLREQVVHPLPSLRDADERLPSIDKRQVGEVPLDCIKLSLPVKKILDPVHDVGPTYCFDRDKTSLRISFMHGTEMISKAAMGKFAGKSVALDQVIVFDGLTAAKSHITMLRSEVLSSTDFAPTSDLTKISDEPVRTDAEITQGSSLKKINPEYPYIAKVNHISGTVLLRAVIGVDGHVRSLRKVYSPDFNLTKASIAAVKQWTYEPFVSNGQPVAVATDITVNFRFGP